MKRLLVTAVALAIATPSSAQVAGPVTLSFREVMQICAVGVFISRSRALDAIARLPKDAQEIVLIICASYEQGVLAGVRAATPPLPHTNDVKV